MKKTVGILMGGYSSEVEISLKSGELVFDSIDRSLYRPYKVHILPAGWYVVDENNQYIIDKNDFSFNISYSGDIKFANPCKQREHAL